MMKRLGDLIPHDVVGDDTVFDVSSSVADHQIRWASGREDVYPTVEAAPGYYVDSPELDQEVEVTGNTYGH